MIRSLRVADENQWVHLRYTSVPLPESHKIEIVQFVCKQFAMIPQIRKYSSQDNHLGTILRQTHF